MATKVTRREFIRGGVAAFTVSFTAPEFLCDLARAQGARSRSLVVLYLSGGNDALNTVVHAIVTLYRGRVVLCSGRQSKHRSVTEAWLAKRETIYDALLIRPTGDSRRDSIVTRSSPCGDTNWAWSACK